MPVKNWPTGGLLGLSIDSYQAKICKPMQDLKAILRPIMTAATITEELLTRYNVSGPRYTSYPTADRFHDEFSENDYVQALSGCRQGTARQPLSLYVHIPFCESLCYYCGCNKIVTRHKEWGTRYLDYLDREIDLNVKALGTGRKVSQLHFGGGTPTFLSDDELARVMGKIRSVFELTPDAEVSVEVDPRTVTAERLAALQIMGFNRLSFGVQDFDECVQQAVHRVQPAQQVFDLVAEARRLGFESINVDLIYGLPLQTTVSFRKTLETIGQLRPDRIAVYGYAHLPSRFKAQRRIAEVDLPPVGDKLHMLSMGIEMLTAQGYEYIGMDHFALPNDALAVAKKKGLLHRNFQGYTTQPDSDMIGLGVSSIGMVGAVYSQNAKTLDDYYAALDNNHLPVERGLILSRDDMVRRAAIASIMCAGELLFESFGQAWLVNAREYFAREIDDLQGMVDDGLVEIAPQGVFVTETGWFMVRLVAMAFDKYLQNARNVQRYSRVL